MAEIKSKWVIDVEENQFQKAVLERSRELPVVVDFWAPWCRPCLMLGPILEKLADQEAGRFLLAKINLDNAPRLAEAYAIESIPAVKGFRDGKPVLEFVGVLPEPQLRQFLDRLCPTEADRLASQAAAVETSKPAEAETLYRRALELKGNHEGALVGLARLLLARGQDSEAGDLLNKVDPGGPQSAEVDRLNSLLSLRHLGQDFGDEVTARRRLEEQPNNAQRRYELGCVLASAGRYPEALEQLLAAAQGDKKLATDKVREAMVRIFRVIGMRSALADDYRDKLAKVLY